MKLLARIYLVCAILLVVCGIVQCVRWTSYQSFSAGFLLHFVPALVFLFAYIASRHIDRKAVHLFAIPVCLITLAWWVLFSFGVEIWMEATADVTDVGRYEEIMSKCGDSTLVGHFPCPIPPDAEDVRFSFFPGFLQGGAHVQLRYRTSPEKISELYERFSKMATQSFLVGDKDGRDDMHVKMPTTSFHTSGSDNYKFPDDYEMMVFDQLPKEGATLNWNHGQSHGVAISKERNEIVYWARYW